MAFGPMCPQTVSPKTADIFDDERREELAQSLGFCGAGGITISRHPKSRASRENAPGPRKQIATHIAIVSALAHLDSNQPNAGSGNHESAIPRHSSPASGLRIGVRKPTKRDTPVINNSRATPKATTVWCPREERLMVPCATSVTPTTARRISKPVPGAPDGNAEKSLCRVCLLRRDLNATCHLIV